MQKQMSALCHKRTHAMQQTERPPRGGLSENVISILIRRLLALSAFCAYPLRAKNGFWTFNRKTFSLLSSLLGGVREIWGMFKYVYADCRRQITVLTPFVDLCNQS